jgi:hypothetical protein
VLDFYSRQRGADIAEGSVNLEIQPKQATVKGPAETFTGDVWFDIVTRAEDYPRMRVNVCGSHRAPGPPGTVIQVARHCT